MQKNEILTLTIEHERDIGEMEKVEDIEDADLESELMPPFWGR